MYLKHLKIANYKSFHNPTEFNFEPGFNILLGANSSGKSSVLEAIAFREMLDFPHRSTLNIFDQEHLPTDKPTSELCFSITQKTLERFALPSTAFFVGIGESSHPLFSQNQEQLNHILSVTPLHFRILHDLTRGEFARIEFVDLPADWRTLGGSSQFTALHVQNSKALGCLNFSTGPDEIVQITQRIAQKIYRFSSERTVQPVCGHHPSGELHSNGSNLAYCINLLTNENIDLYTHLNRLIHRIFPTIHRVAAPPNGNGQFALQIHTTPSEVNRGDLAVPINQVGTGVGNALAMLYVALTAQTQRLILLEEPNSFLHPRALRELLAILAEIGGKHQFFVTTHSSDVLRTIQASTVTLLEHDGQQTTVKQTSGKKLHELKAGLVDLGISLTDLHGCDKVLWVEGETEEAVFPLLLRKYLPEQAQGIAVLPLHATGDFESRKYSPKKVAEIYKKLSQGSFLAPPMVAIALDRERRREEEMKAIESECAGVVHFLPKSMLEDYFLHPAAIRTVLNESSDCQVSEVEVANALQSAQQSEKCLLDPKNPNSTATHAARVLNEVFQGLGTLAYHKTSHGPQLVEWLLTNAPDHLTPLKEWLNKVMQSNS